MPDGSALISVAMSHGPCEMNQPFTVGKSRRTLSSGCSHSVCNLELVARGPDVNYEPQKDKKARSAKTCIPGLSTVERRRPRSLKRSK